MMPLVPPTIRTFHHDEFALDRLLEAKGGRTVSVCIPARNEAATVGAVVQAVIGSAEGGRATGLADEVVVVDDGSTDATGECARNAGARVLRVTPGGDKGRAMATALAGANGDLIVFLDADVENTTERFVRGLLGPLLLDSQIALVKGCYDRPLNGEPTGGGRVTELVAKPLIELLFPELSGVHQPLAGETAAPRWVFEKLDFADGYGVELGLLVDAARRFGPDAIVQVDLGVRVHRNRPLPELRRHATDVLRAAFARTGPSFADPRGR